MSSLRPQGATRSLSMSHRSTFRWPVMLPALLTGTAVLAGSLPARADQEQDIASISVSAVAQVRYRVEPVDGVEVFYREAGPKGAPTVLLLHGFPSSSHMFRDLIPALADSYHVVAPDLPGFGFTRVPAERG